MACGWSGRRVDKGGTSVSGGGHQPEHQGGRGEAALVQQAVERHQVCFTQFGRQLHS